jgi:hypothetical protein
MASNQRFMSSVHTFEHAHWQLWLFQIQNEEDELWHSMLPYHSDNSSRLLETCVETTCVSLTDTVSANVTYYTALALPVTWPTKLLTPSPHHRLTL